MENGHNKNKKDKMRISVFVFFCYLICRKAQEDKGNVIRMLLRSGGIPDPVGRRDRRTTRLARRKELMDVWGDLRFYEV